MELRPSQDTCLFLPEEEWGLLGRTVMELSGRTGMWDIFTGVIIGYTLHTALSKLITEYI